MHKKQGLSMETVSRGDEQEVTRQGNGRGEQFQVKGKAEMKQLVLFGQLKAVGSFPRDLVYLQKPVLGSLKEVKTNSMQNLITPER